MTVSEIYNYVRDMRDDAEEFALKSDGRVTLDGGKVVPHNSFGAGYTAGYLAASKKVIRFIQKD